MLKAGLNRELLVRFSVDVIVAAAIEWDPGMPIHTLAMLTRYGLKLSFFLLDLPAQLALAAPLIHYIFALIFVASDAPPHRVCSSRAVGRLHRVLLLARLLLLGDARTQRRQRFLAKAGVPRMSCAGAAPIVVAGRAARVAKSTGAGLTIVGIV